MNYHEQMMLFMTQQKKLAEMRKTPDKKDIKAKEWFKRPAYIKGGVGNAR